MGKDLSSPSQGTEFSEFHLGTSPGDAWGPKNLRVVPSCSEFRATMLGSCSPLAALSESSWDQDAQVCSAPSLNISTGSNRII